MADGIRPRFQIEFHSRWRNDAPVMPQIKRVTFDGRPMVLIDLPDGALAGWPVVIDALERAKAKTGLTMVFGGLIEQIKAQTEPDPPKPYREHSLASTPWPEISECHNANDDSHECPQCAWEHEHDWVAWTYDHGGQTPIRCSKCGGRKCDQDLCPKQRHHHTHNDIGGLAV